MARSLAPEPILGSISTDLLAAPAALPVMLAIAWLLPAGPFTAIGLAVLLVAIALSPAPVTSAAFRLTLPFLAMAAWATFMGRDNDRYDMLKDLWYALKIALTVMLGFMLGIRAMDSRRALTGFLWFALASALWSIVTWRSAAGASLDTVNLEGFEHLSLSCVAALPIVYWRVLRDRGAAQFIWGGVGAIIAFAILLSASRTTIVASGIMMFAAFGLFSNWRRMVIAIALIAAAAYLAYLILPTYSGGDLTLASKFQRSFSEIFLTDSTDPFQMMMNWRGFEAYNAQLLFNQSPFLRKLFGNGFGTMVDLGIELRAPDGSITRFLPLLHNGYYHILTKYGILGILTYVGALLWYAHVGRQSADASTQEDRLLRGLVGSVLFATLVVTGLYNKGALQDMTILLAWLIGQGCRARFNRILFLGHARATTVARPAGNLRPA